MWHGGICGIVLFIIILMIDHDHNHVQNALTIGIFLMFFIGAGYAAAEDKQESNTSDQNP